MAIVALEKITLLNKISLDSLDSGNKLQIFKNFVDAGIKILNADFGFIWYKFGRTDPYELVYTSKNLDYDPHYPRQKGANYRVQRQKIPLLISNVVGAKFLSSDTRQHAKSVAVLPIFYKRNTFGNMVFGYRNRYKFSKEDEALAVALGNSAGQVLTIERLLKQKDEFLGIASHELRTPLTTIKGFTQLLQTKLSGRDEANERFLAKINTQVDNLGSLVNELLDVSKIEAGKLIFESLSVDLDDLIRNLIEDLQFTTDNHRIILSGKIRGSVRGDRVRLSQVLINVIMNAVKYSPGQKKVLVKLKRTGQSAQIVIQDFGIGIPKAFQNQIFQRFFQGHTNKTHAFPGLGLGLFISKEIVTRHGGEIWCESRRGRGTKFIIKLPLSPSHD